MLWNPRIFAQKLRSYANYIRPDEKNAVQTYNHLAYEYLMSFDWSYIEGDFHEALDILITIRKERFGE